MLQARRRVVYRRRCPQLPHVHNTALFSYDIIFFFLYVHQFGPGTIESGWEENNVFQSGNESSSPVRAPKVKRESSGRKSSAKKSRMSMSAPPDMSPTRPSFPSSAVSPPQSRFEPELPESLMKPRSRLVPIKVCIVHFIALSARIE